MKWKVNYEGFSYVEADSKEEAFDLAGEYTLYDEKIMISAEQVDEFLVEI